MRVIFLILFSVVFLNCSNKEAVLKQLPSDNQEQLNCQSSLVKLQEYVKEANNKDSQNKIKEDIQDGSNEVEVLSAEFILESYECVADNAIGFVVISTIVFRYQEKCNVGKISANGIGIENNNEFSVDFSSMEFLTLDPTNCP